MEQLVARRAHIRRGGHRFEALIEIISIKIYRGMEQLVARRAHNPKVTGSSPVPATLKEGASASFFCLGRILALGSQDC